MQRIIKAESAKVEFAFLLEAEHSDDVLEFFDQPPPIELSTVIGAIICKSRCIRLTTLSFAPIAPGTRNVSPLRS